MGTSISTFLSSRVPQRKRKAYDYDYLAGDGFDYYGDTPSPKRRRIMSTSKYIYKTLFEEGRDSDVKIIALEREWNLHKLYLCQSPYFTSMFSGSWVEAEENVINMGIEDPNITAEALNKVFGSLYQDEIFIEESEAVSILATATLLQLDDVINQSVATMIESINLNTAVAFLEGGQQYGLKSVYDLAFDWLCRNTMTMVYDSPNVLQQISSQLMVELISSPKFVVVQTEFTLYMMLKVWLFLQKNPLWNGPSKECAAAADKYISSLAENGPVLPAESEYLLPFRALRLKHLIHHHVDMRIIDTDHIIPVAWLAPIFKVQWYQMLRVDQGVDRGPKMLTEEEFEKQCVRCGRVLTTETQHMWRWTGFNFGFDLVFQYSSRTLRLCRNERAENDQRNTQHLPRHLMYSITVYSIDKTGKITHTAEKKVTTVSLAKHEKAVALRLDHDMPFPLTLSAKFLIATPLPQADILRPPGCTSPLPLSFD